MIFLYINKACRGLNREGSGCTPSDGYYEGGEIDATQCIPPCENC